MTLDNEIERLNKDTEERTSKKTKDLIILLKTTHFKSFLQSLIDYFKELFEIDNKMANIYKKAKESGLRMPDILPKEKDKLIELARIVGVNYSWILICFIHQRTAQRDSQFFEVSPYKLRL